MPTLLEQFQQQEQAAKAANLQRYQAAMEIYDEIISRYRPGGEFGKAALGQLEARKVRDVGKETQQLISSGLYGTTTMAATGRRWEEAVGGPERLKLEDIQMQRLSEAQVGKAGFIERREDIGPDYGMIAQLASRAGQAPTRAAPTSTYGQYDPNYMESLFGARGGAAAPRPKPQTSAEYYATRRVQEGGGVSTTPTTTPTTRGQYGTYYGAGAAAPTAPTPTAPAGGDTAAYNAWAAEIRRRYPNKPVMPMSRWRQTVKPKMGATYGQFAGGTYGQAS